jgi:hypothetical protein
MRGSPTLRCDGCGQQASAEHIARRLKRLEWSTRFRPVHIQTLLLGAVAPASVEEFVYSPETEFRGEAGLLLRVAGLNAEGKTREQVQAEFQRAGFYVNYVLECPREDADGDASALGTDLGRKIPEMLARLRRSLKPKRVALISSALSSQLERLCTREVLCPVILGGDKPFALDSEEGPEQAIKLQEVLSRSATAT